MHVTVVYIDSRMTLSTRRQTLVLFCSLPRSPSPSRCTRPALPLQSCCDHHYHHYITVIIISYLLTFTNILNSNITTTTYNLFCLTSKNLGMLRAKETMVTGTVYTSNRFVLLIAFKRNKYNCKYVTLQGTSTAQKVIICNFHIKEVLG